MKRTIQELQQLQALPLDIKVAKTKLRIKEWVDTFGLDGVYVSFSGGKDSTVLLTIARELYPDIKAVFIDTGLEYPEVRQFVKTWGNVEWLKPEMSFKKVIYDYGYPIISKDIAQAVYDVRTQARIQNKDARETRLYHRDFDVDSDYAKKYPQYCRNKWDFLLDADFKITCKCCDIMKKHPAKRYEKESGKHPILATMAEESRLRKTQWQADGCNAFDSKRPTSKPMSFWCEQDVLRYIAVNKINIAKVYGDVVYEDSDGLQYGEPLFLNDMKLVTTGCKRTGCMFCMFGCSNKRWDNFIRMKQTHPKQYDYIMKPWDEGGLDYKNVIDWINEHGNLHIRY